MGYIEYDREYDYMYFYYIKILYKFLSFILFFGLATFIY